MLNKILNAINYRIGWTIGKLLLFIRKKTKPQIVSISNIQLPIPDNITRGPLEALYQGYYEREELALLKRHLDKNDIVMEVGTGLGLLAAYCSIELGSDKVVTYEANPSLQPYIKQTFSLNKVDPHLTICILGDKEGEQKFYVQKSFWSSSTIPNKESGITITVPVISFQEELQKIKPTLLLIDIEGGEYELLNSTKLDTVKKIIMELHTSKIGKEKANSILETLKEQRFLLQDKSAGGRELFFERQ